MEVMEGSLIRFETGDRLMLEGFLVDDGNNTNKAIIYVHGLTGNFYKGLGLKLSKHTWQNRSLGS